MHRYILTTVTAFSTLVNGFMNVKVGPAYMNKNIDPIVVLGQCTSHMHTFFGSDALTINTTTSAELRKGCTTANNPNDFSAYWIPELYHVTGTKYTPIPVSALTVYYNEDLEQAETMIPEDLTMIAGNATAKSATDSNRKSRVTWFCDEESFTVNGKAQTDFPQIPVKQVNYARSCSSHNVSNHKHSPRVTQAAIHFDVHWDVSSITWKNNAPFQLSCGDSYCFHGDFINGWTPETMKSMVTTLTDPDNFQNVAGSHGSAVLLPTCKAEDADPSNGTDDYDISLKMKAAAVTGNAPSTSKSTSSKPTTFIANCCSAL